MVQRQYQAPDFGGRDTREVQRLQVANADTRPAVPLQVGDDTWRDKLLMSLAEQGKQVLDKATDLAFQNEYLEGAAQVGIAESEDELQGDWLTRDWKVAGFRDTTGKLALAEADAQFQTDLGRLREQSPERLQEYLADRRAKLTPLMASMSREARAATAGQLLVKDRAAISRHTAEHAKFIAEQKVQAVHTQWTATSTALRAAETEFRLGGLPADKFTNHVRDAAGTLFASVWGDSSWSPDMQKQATHDVLKRSLSQGSVELFEYIQANALPDGKGVESSLVSRLNAEQQQSLADAYRTAKQANIEGQSFQSLASLANVRSQIKAGVYQGTYAGLENFLRPMVLNKFITADAAANVLQDLSDSQYKGEVNSLAAQAVIRNDAQALRTIGLSPEQGYDAVEASLRRQGMSAEQRMSTWLAVGLAGDPEGFKRVGADVSLAVNQLVTSKGEVLPQHRGTFIGIADAVRQAELNGLQNARVKLLEGVPQESRAFVERVLALSKGGDAMSVADAIERARTMQASEAAMSPDVRAARSAGVAGKVEQEIDAMEPRGLFSTLYHWAGAKLGSESSAQERAARPSETPGARGNFFGNRASTLWYAGAAKGVLREEVSKTMLLNPELDSKSALSLAKAGLLSRTIETDHGPVYLPSGVDRGSVFGVGPANQALIGPAISELVQPVKSDSNVYLYFSNGKLLANEVDAGGNHIKSHDIAPQEVVAQVEAKVRRSQQYANWTFGAGREVRTSSGAVVRYGGKNSAGVPGVWMYGFRENLIAHEGIVTKAADDVGGQINPKTGKVVQTVGVGVSDTNTYYPKPDADGKITPEALQESFLKASDEAARIGARWARNTGRNNQFGFQLMSEIAYQAGGGAMTSDGAIGDRYREFAAALQGNDVEAAKAAFMRTSVWYGSRNRDKPTKPTARQKNYLTLIENTMR